MDIAATLFAGLGLFFVGLRLISKNLGQIVGPRTRILLSRSLAGRGSTLAFGAMLGGVMQSVNAVTLLLVALVSAGAIEVRRAFPIIGWANIGTSAIVLVASLDIHLLVLAILGVVGVAYYLNLDQAPRYRHAVGALLGVGVLFLGVDLIKGLGGTMQHIEPTALFGSIGGRFEIVAFGIGVLVTLASQSSTTITIVAMALGASGLLSLENGALVVVGSGLGSAISAAVLALRMRGSGKQLMVYQAVLKGCGVVVMVTLLAIDAALGGRFLSFLFTATGNSVSIALAMVYVLLQVSSDVLMHVAHGPLIKLVERSAPLTREELLSKPEHLMDSALDEPQVALLLVDREQQALIARLPHYLDPLREDRAGAPPRALPEADRKVARRCEQFLRDVADRNPSRDVLDRAMLLRDRNALIASLQETLAELCQAAKVPGAEPIDALRVSIVESLHMLLETLADVVSSGDPEYVALFRTLTEDRSDMMEAIRRRPAAGDRPLDPGAQHALITITSLFERAVWLLRRQLLLVDRLDSPAP